MDDLKISFYERDVKVYEKKGTVVCRLVGVFYNEEIVGYGVARCKSNDTFDEEKGTRIATAIAENNVYNKALKLARQDRLQMRETQKKINGFIDSLSRFVEKGERTVKHNWEYIQRVDNNQVTYRRNKSKK